MNLDLITILLLATMTSLAMNRYNVLPVFPQQGACFHSQEILQLKKNLELATERPSGLLTKQML